MKTATKKKEGIPSISELADAIIDLKRSLEKIEGFEYPVDIRIQVKDGNWHLYWGDPQYDQDHTGAWAYGEIRSKTHSAKEIAKSLIRCLEWDWEDYMEDN